MPSQIENYKCPACGGPLHFVGASGRLECEYCGRSYSVEEIQALQQEKEQKAEEAYQQAGGGRPEDDQSAANVEIVGDWDASAVSSDWGTDAPNMRVYNCPSCGAELICDDKTAATHCPYCNNPTIVPGQFSGIQKPDYVIPFKLNRQDAIAALKKHYGGKRFLPRAFEDRNHIEQIQGVYVPFWLFDGTADAELRFDATNSTSHREGDYRVTTTSHFDVERAGSVSFERVPVDASSKMPDEHMDSLEPYDYSELKPFSTAYMPGFLADVYDVSAEDAFPRADVRCTATTRDLFEDTVRGYSTTSLTYENIRVRRGKVSYAFLPVWVLSTKWNGKNFLFAMNGQTGRIVGDLPVSKGKLWGSFFLWLLIIGGGLALILFLLGVIG